VSDIFREIDEDLRRDNLAKLWSRYGSYVIALAVAIVLVTAAGVAWREYQVHQRQAEGVRYAAALDIAHQGNDAAAADAFGAVAREAGSGHAVLARLEQAAMRAKSGNAVEATALYDAIARDGSVDQAYRDVATLLAVRHSLDATDPKAAVERLAPLTEANNPWHPTALELTGLAQLKAGDKAAARATFQRLADDLSAPQGLRARATEMAAALPQ
jgi:hypothetical protein